MKASHSANTCPKCGATIPADAPQGLCPKCVLARAATGDAALPAAATATSQLPSLDRVRAAFPQLEVLELVGRGGMGFVFKARQPHLDRFVALKLLPDKLASDPQFTERFSREGRFLARLHHPNIVSVFDFGQTRGFCYLLMEYVDGVNLRQAMQAGRFSPGEALAIVPKICEALQYAHEQGVLHRDIKPENILLDAKGRVKIADFGIAKLMGDAPQDVTLTGTGVALGTPHYMAPEQLEKPAEVDHRADIYSLGVVFYEMLTGELPIGRFAAPSSKTPVDRRIDEVVFRALEKEKERRFQSAGEVRQTVQTVAATQADPGRSPGAGASAGAGAAATPSDADMGPHGTVVVEPPRISRLAVAASVLTALNFPWPMFLAVASLAWGNRGIGTGELLLALGGFCLFGLPGTILGWMAMIKIRASRGRLQGLPLAVFAGLTWPLLGLVLLLAAAPLALLAYSPGPIGHLQRLLLVLLPAGTLTFVLWAIHATIRWASHASAPERRGVLKWVFLGLIASGLGLTASFNFLPSRGRIAASPQPEPTGSTDTNPAIGFTFTSVELLQKDGALWLAFDYVDHAVGNCEPAFSVRCDLPNFHGQTVKSTFRAQPEGAPPVRHQRISFRLPESLTPEQLEPFRARLAETWVAKTVRVPLDTEKELFRLLLPLSDSKPVALTGFVTAVAPLPPHP